MAGPKPDQNPNVVNPPTDFKKHHHHHHQQQRTPLSITCTIRINHMLLHIPYMDPSMNMHFFNGHKSQPLHHPKTKKQPHHHLYSPLTNDFRLVNSTSRKPTASAMAVEVVSPWLLALFVPPHVDARNPGCGAPFFLNVEKNAALVRGW